MSISKKIYQRKGRKNWYCKINGKEVNLGPDRKHAQAKWHELANQNFDPSVNHEINIKVKPLLKKYLAWVKVNRAKSSYRFCLRACRGTDKWPGFGNRYATLAANSLRPYHLSSWADENFGSASANTRRKYMVTIQRAFSWALDQGLINKNPFAKIEKPKQEHREEFIKAEDWPKLLKACSPPFDELVRFTLLTGARPQESRIVAAKHIGNSTIVLPVKDSKGNRKNRVIYLNEAAKELVQRLSKQYPEGPIFRNSDGIAWDKNSINCRMRRLKKKLDWPWLCLTVVRHSFAHAHVSNGTDALLLQSLMGHSSTRMLETVYAHSDKAVDALTEAANTTAGLLPS